MDADDSEWEPLGDISEERTDDEEEHVGSIRTALVTHKTSHATTSAATSSSSSSSSTAKDGSLNKSQTKKKSIAPKTVASLQMRKTTANDDIFNKALSIKGIADVSVLCHVLRHVLCKVLCHVLSHVLRQVCM